MSNVPVFGVVYGLSCSCSPAGIRYVGLTTTTAAKRLTQHLREVTTYRQTAKACWLRKHVQLGHTIQTQVLEESPVDELGACELKWMEIGRTRGWSLTNGHGLRWTQASQAVRAQLSAALLAYYADPANREALLARAAAEVSAETRAQMSASRRAYFRRAGVSEAQGQVLKASWAAAPARRAKAAETQRAVMADPEARARIAAATKAFAQTAEGRRQTAARVALGGHTRWHVNRGIIKPGCTYCAETEKDPS